MIGASIHSQSEQNGFSLIELLVVIFVIGVLAGLLLPVVGRSKALASRTQCANNLRQIAIAIRFYSTENNDRVPTFASDQPFWRADLQPYLGLQPVPSKSDRVFVCPKDREWFNFPYSSHRFTSYEYNGFHISTSAEPRRWWSLDGVTDPSITVLNAEAGARFWIDSFHEPLRGDKSPTHLYFFVDGHSAFLKTFVDWSVGTPKGYSVVGDIWQPEPPSRLGYTWNVE